MGDTLKGWGGSGKGLARGFRGRLRMGAPPPMGVTRMVVPLILRLLLREIVLFMLGSAG